MKIKIRYKYWQVMLGLVLLGIVAAILYSISGSDKEKHVFISDPGITPFGALKGIHEYFYLVTLLFFALNYFYNAIADNKKLISVLKLFAIISLFAYGYRTFLFFLIPALLQDDYSSLFDLYGDMLGGLIPLLLFCYLFANVTYMWESKKQRRILEAQKLQLESQISQANFNFLKSQINPHFLHNTLNFLYAKSLPYSAELSEGILTLSDIMRYALEQGNQKDGKAPLKDEIEHVQNVIKISQLRYDNQLNVKFDITGSAEGVTIVPFVLITIVENAFKHGDLKNPQYPLQINLQVQGSRLYFYCSNKKRNGPRQLSTGIGLENIRKRLDIAYGGAYKFNIKDEPDFYTTELIIDKL